MATVTWIKPSGSPIEIDENFDAKALKALGWKKKPGPKPIQKEEQKPIQTSLGD